MRDAVAAEPMFELVDGFFKVSLFPISGGVDELLEYMRTNPGEKKPGLQRPWDVPQRYG